MEVKNKLKQLSDLPSELILKICTELKLSHVNSLQQSCKQIYGFINSNLPLWSSIAASYVPRLAHLPYRDASHTKLTLKGYVSALRGNWLNPSFSTEVIYNFHASQFSTGESWAAFRHKPPADENSRGAICVWTPGNNDPRYIEWPEDELMGFERIRLADGSFSVALVGIVSRDQKTLGIRIFSPENAQEVKPGIPLEQPSLFMTKTQWHGRDQLVFAPLSQQLLIVDPLKRSSLLFGVLEGLHYASIQGLASHLIATTISTDQKTSQLVVYECGDLEEPLRVWGAEIQPSLSPPVFVQMAKGQQGVAALKPQPNYPRALLSPLEVALWNLQEGTEIPDRQLSMSEVSFRNLSSSGEWVILEYCTSSWKAEFIVWNVVSNARQVMDYHMLSGIPGFSNWFVGARKSYSLLKQIECFQLNDQAEKIASWSQDFDGTIDNVSIERLELVTGLGGIVMGGPLSLNSTVFFDFLSPLLGNKASTGCATLPEHDGIMEF